MKFKDVNEGDILIADGGFTCIKEGSRLTVSNRYDDGLYVPCDVGEHYLDGGHDHATGDLIGFAPYTKNQND